MKDITPTLLMMTAAMVAIIIAEGLVSGVFARN
jgi:hypothetical protein